MAIKTTTAVDQYIRLHAELIAGLANLQEFMSNLPAPDENGEVLGLYYGHINTLEEIKRLIGDCAEVADGF
jgi:hypothetical protein